MQNRFSMPDQIRLVCISITIAKLVNRKQTKIDDVLTDNIISAYKSGQVKSNICLLTLQDIKKQSHHYHGSNVRQI